MTNTNSTWKEYVSSELKRTQPLLDELGIELDDIQVHIQGERCLLLMDGADSRKKLVLIGKASDGRRVVVKVSSDPEAKKEIKREQKTRKSLDALPFAYNRFYSPKEIASIEKHDLLVVVTEYISQDKAFLHLDSKEQFFLSMQGLEAQEGAHATTHEHRKFVQKVFGFTKPSQYIENIEKFKQDCDGEIASIIDNIHTLFESSQDLLHVYGEFLTHDDFVPHNIRVSDGRMYLLDHTALTFGNKYESWARLINYMVLFNPELEKYLLEFVEKNRAKSEYKTLKLMRLYKIAYLLAYYSRAEKVTTGDHQELTRARIRLWSYIAANVLADTQYDPARIIEHKKLRDRLRSEEEIERQKELGQL
ncbi:MAG: hypothetical protein ACPGO5_02410 [Patescibacteria group bacterium]